jgi:predicted O-methyltransferase YrrM
MKKEEKINITEISLNKVNDIISKMEGKSFHNHYHILYDICNSITKKNITYLEIGAYCGGSASLVSTNENVSKVYSIDIGHPIPKEVSIKNVNKFKHSNCEYEYFHGNSRLNSTIEKVKSSVPEIDVFFIDGDHSYNAVIEDFNNYKDLVSKGGVIVFDDYHDKIHSPDVFHAVNDIVKNLSTNEYEIIGSLDYELLKLTNRPNIKSSNEFILRKK